jgi:hypothetical protein
MGCNWELFELRVIVFTNAVEAGSRGLAGQGPKFFSVTLDLLTLGIGNFKGSGLDCDFKSVFDQLIKQKAIKFNCRQAENEGGHFGRVQAAERNKEMLPGAKLYVHVRGGLNSQNVYPEKFTEPGVLLKGVTIRSAVVNNGSYYIYLEGYEASQLNF